MQISSMGYFVFTLPLEVRGRYRTKKRLTKLGHDIQELLKSFGFKRGLRRWHWFGDIAKNGLRGEVVFHPHLNVLLDGGYVSEAKLEAIKRAYAQLLSVSVVDMNYRYTNKPGKIIHHLKYITRATFRDYSWDMDMAMELRGFRNMVVWGRGQWDSQAAWSLSDLRGEAKAEVDGLDLSAIQALVEKRCPVCGEALVWGEALPIGILNMLEKKSLGAGYWRLSDIPPPPPSLPDSVKQRLCSLELKHRAEVKAASERAEAEARQEAEYQAHFWQDIQN